MNTDNELKKAWLMRYLHAKRRKNEADDELDQICTPGSRAIIYSDMPHGSPDLTGLESIAIRAELQLDELRKATTVCMDTRDEVRKAIDALPSETEQLVMYYRYMCFQQSQYEREHRREGTRQLSWDEIAERMDYSYGRVTHIHGDALNHLQIPETWMLARLGKSKY
jgi:DNA-directed RNA polymerase specialized sigma24 family protein